MGFSEKRYKRRFEKADYGKFKNAIYDTVNKMFGFMPSTVFEQTIEMKIGGDNMEMTKEQIKKSLENYSKVAILPDEKSSDYYEGFYDGIQAILKIIKGA